MKQPILLFNLLLLLAERLKEFLKDSLPLLGGDVSSPSASQVNRSLGHHISSVFAKKVFFCSSASPRGLGLWQCPTSSCSRGPNPWLVSTTQTELWRCSTLSSLTTQVCTVVITSCIGLKKPTTHSFGAHRPSSPINCCRV